LQGSGFNQGALNSEPKSAAEAFSKLQAELISAEIQLSTLRASLSDSAPQVSRQMALVQALRKKVGEIEQSEPVGKSGQGKDDYISRYREFKYQEALFELFSRQYELARVDESREGSQIQIIDVATPAEHKIRPKRLLFGIYTALSVELFALMLLIHLGRRQVVR
jgi:capsule polysaccharide export protein KpsE/RkpR